ncbi:hypothetical protein SRRS_18200 [Sporomusa rhizae]
MRIFSLNKRRHSISKMQFSGSTKEDAMDIDAAYLAIK